MDELAILFSLQRSIIQCYARLKLFSAGSYQTPNGCLLEKPFGDFRHASNY
jgi:hypothetical protein